MPGSHIYQYHPDYHVNVSSNEYHTSNENWTKHTLLLTNQNHVGKHPHRSIGWFSLAITLSRALVVTNSWSLCSMLYTFSPS